MRLLFSATPAYGHVLPLAGYLGAAVEAGHEVALLTSGGFRDEAMAELPPETDFLAAGVMPGEFSAQAARPTGADMFHPGPELIGEIFGGARVDLGGEESWWQAREWGPDLIVAEGFDAIGPLVAARLGIRWYQVGVGCGIPAAIVDEIERAAAVRHRAAGPAPVPASSYLDQCPSALRDPEWSSRVPVQPVRAQAHRRLKPVEFTPPDFADPGKPTVLVTLGTIFSDPEVLAATVSAVTGQDVNVLATVGLSMRNPDAAAPPSGDRVHYLPFVPLDQLLDLTDLVVGSGGAGTVLGALAHGLPMVLWPQGAEQPINAARAAASGASITVDSAVEITAAVARILGDDSYRNSAREIAAEIQSRPGPAEIIKELALEPR